MRTWERTGHVRLCGGCGRTIQVGETVLLIQIIGLRDSLARCQGCAEHNGHAAPALPPYVAPVIQPRPYTPQPTTVMTPEQIERLSPKPAKRKGKRAPKHTRRRAEAWTRQLPRESED